MRRYRSCIVVTFLAGLICLLPEAASADGKDTAFLLDGVSQISAPGIPGPLCLIGDEAFAVVAGGLDGGVQAAVVAAAATAKGRVVAFGHPDYLSEQTLETADTGRLMLNAIRWAGRKTGEDKPAVAVFQADGVSDYLKQQGIEARQVSRGGLLAEQLEGVDVLCVYPARVRSDEQIEAIKAFVRAGGGLIAADLGWGWLQLNPGKTLQTDHIGNRLLVDAGILWADGYLKKTSDAGYTANAAPSGLLRVNPAIGVLKAHESGSDRLADADVSQAVSTIMTAIRTVPNGSEVIGSKLGRIGQDTGNTIPGPENPLSKRRNPLARLLFSMQVQDAMQAPAEQVKAHPAAELFPGSVPAEAKAVTRSISIDTNYSGWHSTGLYAPPGKVISVEIEEDATGKGLGVQIGAHSDTLWNKETWRRSPELCSRFKLDKPLTLAANAFGGPVYIDVPGGRSTGVLNVKIGGGIEAPFYVLGKTDLQQWRDEIRTYPAPWAELATNKVVLTIPAKVVRQLDDPEKLMEFWDKVMDSCADLAGWPRERKRTERYVADTQISAGYMHSGYPIMVQLDIIEALVDRDKLMTNAHGGVWGLFHETGHNHQSPDWTFAGTGEVTVNLFTLYVLENVCGINSEAHPSFTKKARTRKLKKYIEDGADFEAWKRDPFLALDMYIQMQEAFGWDAFKKAFAEYRNLPASERPGSDADKRDQWLVRFSRTVGRNLGPYFEAWGVPTSESARDSIKEMPVWLPADFPSK
ncbi:MAG: M60 family metallopeptidase [Sedimentisphaerales bacterium]|nr:M60 family metallopeptidase [Sedimentisphaerales bacterium]